jgi:hypothetical protein
MDLSQIPTLTDVEIAISTVKTDPALLAEAKARGFYNGHTPYNALFGSLFFRGGKLNFKKRLDPEFKTTATRYLRALMGSFEPSHEDKEAVCALLLSELVKA